mmetsp:Transcript_50284/g.116736  ORF Transcript_50284/g.116736 Transcript_50284/m.116736 type:complete len:226 (-) Transcript_50284:82-759(-)
MTAVRGAPHALVVQKLHAVLPQVVADGVGLSPILLRACLLTLRHAHRDLRIRECAVHLVATGDDNALLAVRRAPEPFVVKDLHAKRGKLPPELVGRIELLRGTEPLALCHELADSGTVDGAADLRALDEAAVFAVPAVTCAPRAVLVIELHTLAPQLIAQRVSTLPLLCLPGFFTLAYHLLDLHICKHALGGPGGEQDPTAPITRAPLLLLVIKLHAHGAKLFTD